MIYDIVIIGGGPAGYVASIRAAQLGKKVALIEKENIGGVCLNWGCIPTKALLHCADVYRACLSAGDVGIRCTVDGFEFESLMQYSKSVVEKMVSGLKGLVKKNKVDVMHGLAAISTTSSSSDVKLGKLQDKSEESQKSRLLQIDIEADGEKQVVYAQHLILATGASPRTLPSLPTNSKNILSYRDVFTQKALPKALLVVGSGAIGMEFASFYNTFGSKVYVIEMQEQILPTEDAEIAELAAKSFQSQGIEIMTQVVIDSVESAESIEDNSKKVEKSRKDLESAESAESERYLVKLRNLKTNEIIEMQFDQILSAVGVIPNVQNLGLESTGVRISQQGFILVDKNMKTDDDRIYAVGDVVAPPYLAHKASHEAILAVEAICGLKTHPIYKERIPGCIYTYPQIASIGYTEKQANELGLEFTVGKFPFFANGKAVALGETFGMIKVLLSKKYGELIGAHMIGESVSELIGNFALSMSAEATAETWLESIFPHPTLSEMLSEAVRVALGIPLHISK